MENAINKNYENLAKAIVLRAAGDYIGALCRIEEAYDMDEIEASELKEAATLFFRSKLFAQMYPEIEGVLFLAQLDKRFEEYKSRGELEELKKLFQVDEHYNFNRERKILKKMKGV